MDQFAAFGLVPIDGELPEGDAPLGIYPWNAQTVQVWCATWQQWRFVSGGLGPAIRIGLDWCQVESVLRMLGLPRRQWPEIFGGLRVMQREALDVLNAEA